ncbi:MAG: transcriptional regulator PpsR [Methylocystis sp.]
MMQTTLARPDVTLTLDDEGVIVHAIPAEALAEEHLELWSGRRFAETVDSDIDQSILHSIQNLLENGASTCFQVKQRFPSGREVPMDYTAISLGDNAGFVAVGRNLQVVSDLKSRLQLAQQAREKDYWRIREFETRYRMLFDATNEAVVLVAVNDLRITEANLAAERSFGLFPGGDFCARMQERDKKGFQAMLEKVREQGRAPSIVLHLSMIAEACSVRASMSSTDAGQAYLLQIASMAPTGRDEQLAMSRVVQRLPQGFVFIDRKGVVLRANDAFLDLAQLPSEAAALGKNLKHWMNDPGADISVLLNLLRKHGSVRRMAVRMEGALGAATDVEVSAVGDKPQDFEIVGLMFNAVAGPEAQRAQPAEQAAQTPTSTSTETPLDQIVRSSTEALERKTIVAALERFGGNRTNAAKYLGLSRQSLHAKLRKYNFDPK